MRNSIYSVTVDEALEVVGGHHAYQKKLVMSMGGCWLAASFYFTLVLSLVSPLEEICDNSESLNSEMNLCFKPTMRYYLLIGFFSGICAGVFILGAFSHYYGKKLILIICSCFGTVLAFVAAASPMPEVLIGAVTGISGMQIAMMMLAFLMVIEVVDAPRRNLYAIPFPVFGALGYVGARLISYYVEEWRIGFILVAILSLLSIFMCAWVFESPRQLACMGKYTLARHILQNIAHKNGRPAFTEMLEGEKLVGYQEPSREEVFPPSPSESTNVTSKKLAYVTITNGIVSVCQTEIHSIQRLSYFDLLRLTSLRSNNIGMNTLCFSLALTYSQCSVLISKMIDEPIFLGYLIKLLELISIITALYLVNRFTRQITLIINLGMVDTAIFITLTFSASQCDTESICNLNHMLQVILSVASRVLVSSALFVGLLYSCELMPSSARTLGLSANLFNLGLGSLLYVGFYSFCREVLKVHSLLIAGLLVGISCFIVCSYPETGLRILSDYADEEKEEMSRPVDVSQIEIPSIPRTTNSDTHRNTAPKQNLGSV